MLSVDTLQKIKELKKQAEEKKVWGDPTLDRRRACFFLANALPNGGQINCWEAMSQDLSTMGLYEIVGWWCDTESGLVSIFPREVIQVCEYILKNA